MTTHRPCCCDVPGYYSFQVCHFTTPTPVSISSADFATCGFSTGTIYKYDPGAPTQPTCGTWVESRSIVGTLLDSTACGDFTSFDTCCDCLGESSACCSYDDCLISRNANNQAVGLSFTGWLGGSGGNDCYDFEVMSVNVSTPTFETSGSSDFRFTIFGSIEVTPSCESNRYRCDGYSTPQAIQMPYEFDVVIECPAYLAPTKLGRKTYPGAYCDNSAEVCPDETEDTFDADTFVSCDRFFFGPQGGNTVPVALSPVPSFSSSCVVTANAAFSMTVPFNVELRQGSSTSPECDGCDEAGIWHGQYFPHVVASSTLSIQGVWS